tara:strand:+ start:48 stop:635 length:588 start_codon:yes stop_codon:yes gene_type:complete
MILTEPIWKSYIVETTTPIFTPQQCQMVIDKGLSLKAEQAKVGMGQVKEGGTDLKKRMSTISWIPFKEMPEMYKQIETEMLRANGNHFGFEGMRLTEPAQFTEYKAPTGHYTWHMDNDVVGLKQPPVRKISMIIPLVPITDYEGGEVEFMNEGKQAKLQQGQAIFFASFLQHRVKAVTKGIRRSMVMWFGGPPLR